MQIARREWIENQPKPDVKKLVFLDETGVSTHMTRTRGRALKGERCVDSAPLGHWKTTTFIAGLRVNEITGPMVLDGPMNGPAFLAYIEQFLCPTLTLQQTEAHFQQVYNYVQQLSSDPAGNSLQGNQGDFQGLQACLNFEITELQKNIRFYNLKFKHLYITRTSIFTKILVYTQARNCNGFLCTMIGF